MKPFKKTYHAHGKLLISGEYLVLDGALALATPTQKGQSLTYLGDSIQGLHWISYDEKGQTWYERHIDYPIEQNSADDPVTQRLKQILVAAKKLNPNFLQGQPGFRVTTHLEFNRDWGLGSSSTLIANIAKWAQIDAYTLLQNSLGGSGYDIACAKAEAAIYYRLIDGEPIVEKVTFNPAFKEQLYFVYLNKKQRSDEAIKHYRNFYKKNKKDISTVSELTQLMAQATALDDFEKVLKEHEILLSKVLDLEPIQKIYFKDYFGQVKSLGAWGGDFILATGNEDTPAYFKQKGYYSILKFEEIIL